VFSKVLQKKLKCI